MVRTEGEKNYDSSDECYTSIFVNSKDLVEELLKVDNDKIKAHFQNLFSTPFEIRFTALEDLQIEYFKKAQDRDFLRFILFLKYKIHKRIEIN